jgi:dipeptidyl aminopeptidase/acylaminoacyl peptidase
VTKNEGFVAVWSPDGRQIAYHDSSQSKLFTIDSDGSHQQLVLNSQESVYINDWSPDGQWLLYTKVSTTTLNDLWLLPITGDRTPTPLLVTESNESHGQFSPDGKWIAFTADDSGQQEIYVRGAVERERTRVSTNGGSFARWRADLKELFYRALDGRLMAVPVLAGGGRLEFGAPAPIMDLVEPLGTYAYPYDIAPDGQTILTLKPASGGRSAAAPLTVLVGWEVGLGK